METEQLIQLIQAVSDSELTHFKYEEKGIKLSLRKKLGIAGSFTEGNTAKETRKTTPTGKKWEELQQSSQSQQAQKERKEDSSTSGNGKNQEGVIVTSPLVGTFYEAPAEGEEPYVKVGDVVEKGQMLAIVEAMKLMNDIESDFAGTVAEIYVENGEAVSYGQPLFCIVEGK